MKARRHGGTTARRGGGGLRLRALVVLLCASAPLWFLFSLAGCTRPPAPPAPQEVRIVSLSPAISRTLVDLGMDRHIVGRTPFCDSLDRSIPVVGDLLDLDIEQLIRVRPTHVLIQPPASGMDARLERLAQERGWTLRAWRLDGVQDVVRLIGDLPQAVYAEQSSERLDAMRSATRLLQEMMHVLALREGEEMWRDRGRTLLVVGVDPVTVFGKGTYLHELLIAAGGLNAIAMNGYPQLTFEDVTRLNPDSIILVRPGADPAISPRQAAGPLARLDVAAVREGRIAVLIHPDAFLPSSALSGVAKELREILATLSGGPQGGDADRNSRNEERDP